MVHPAQAIREDLLTYSKEDLLILARYYNIPASYWPVSYLLVSLLAGEIWEDYTDAN